MSTAPPRLDRRPPRSLPVVMVGLLLLAGGLAASWLLGTLLVEGSWPAPARDVLDSVGALTLDSTPVHLAAGILAVLGLLLLLAALVPGTPSRSLVLSGEIPGSTVVSRRDLARRVSLRVEHGDGVHSARTRITGRRVDVLVRTVVDDSDAVLGAALAIAEQSVHELRPTTAFRTRARVQRMN